MHEDGLHLGAEQQIRAVAGDVQRLDAHAVASQHQALARFSPQCDGEHTAQPRKTIRVPFEKRRQRRFGVRAGAKAMAAPLQFHAQFRVVVDLAVEGDDCVAALGEDGLVAGIEVDDLQPRGA